jgi:exopolysaccharide biosynthesis polyprenyl glycosylphosphotransferase
MEQNNKSNGFILKFIEEIIYVAFVVLGFYLAFMIRFDMNPLMYNIQPFYDNIPYIILVSIVIFYIYNIVSTIKKTIFENALIIALALFIIDISVIAIVFFNRGFSFPRSVILLGYVIQFTIIFTLKIIILKFIKLNWKQKNILIIASKEESEELAVKMLLDKVNFDNLKYISNHVNDETYKLIDISEKVYLGKNIDIGDKIDVIEYCSKNNKDVYLIPGSYELAMMNSKTNQIKDILFLKVDKLGLTFEQIIVKRAIDIVASLVGLVLLSPILTIVALIIKIYDGGPIFYKQERVTINNKSFKLYKFRTMIVDAEKKTGPVLASDNDDRITILGKFLRSTRIDEFPQLINVLKGEMSLVGPRPERPYFVEKYNEENEEYKYRTYVKAGITGLAQILSNYSTTAENKAKYDLLYIRNYSLMLDIIIIFNTIKIMFMKDHSEGVAVNKKLEEILNEQNLKAEEELGITKVDSL